MPRFLWTQKQDIGPSPRSHCGLAYDSMRKLAYLFGGWTGTQDNPVFNGDTWAWDGRYWTQVSRLGPGPRSAMSLTFDGGRGNTVLFGGAADTVRGDTWLFDGDEWTQVEDIGPGPRTAYAMAYDAARERVVLFGGNKNGSEPAGDTWEWDGTSWTQVEEDGPDARNAPVMAFDSIRNRTVLFGGWAPGEPATHLRGDTWEWDGTRWTQVADTGPEARFGAAMASTGGSLVLHGGMSTQPIGDSWQWVHSTWSKVTELGPGARYVHSMTYDTDRARVVLFGGQYIASGQAGGYARDGDTWEAPAIPGPVPSGPGPDNLMVSPGIVSLSQGPAPVIEFDTASSNATRHFLIYLINAAGQRVPIDDGVIVPGQTHAAHQVPKNSLAMGMNQLGLLAPVDAAFSTDLGTNFVVFHIVG